MTFREALQQEIDDQGLSVAQVAKDSNLSKGAIYNILNGTTEDARIRPATRKAIAEACGRALRADRDGVTFEALGQSELVTQETGELGAVVLSWVRDRLFLKERHAASAFDWIHRMEESGQLDGTRLVDRVFQNRPDFVSMMVHNKGTQGIERVTADVSVAMPSGDETTYNVSVPGPIAPGESSEFTVFAGVSCTLQIDRAECSDASGRSFPPMVPDVLRITGGSDD